jgi:hypothetical protein
MNMQQIFFCDCGEEALVFEYDKELEIAELAFLYRNLYSHKRMTLKQKIRYIFRVLWYGQPFIDQIVLNKKQIRRLQKILTQIN